MGVINILNQLLTIIKQYENIGKSVSEGDLYGLVDEDGSVFVISCFLSLECLPHDPKLLLPSSFTRLGKLFIANDSHFVKDYTCESDSIVLSFSKESNDLKIYTNDENGLRETEFSTCEESNVYNRFIIGRIFFSGDLKVPNSSSGVDKAIDNLREEIMSSSSFFRMRNSQLLFQNNDEGSILSGSGTNTAGNDVVESLIRKGNKKKIIHPQFDFVTFDLMVSKSQGLSTAPVAQCNFNKMKFYELLFDGEAIVYIPKAATLSKIGNFLASAVEQQLELMKSWFRKQIGYNNISNRLKAYYIKHYLVGYFLNLTYPTALSDQDLEEYRKQIHSSFMFPTDYPIARKTNLFKWQNEFDPFILINPHEGIPKQELTGSEESVVHGLYTYHHYMQNKFDDNKWGCAYRSLQTLVSWFRLQGYTDKPIPSHKDIQQILVNIKDKPASFVGSKQWIGSTEVGFVLENYLNISSKFIFVNSGADLPSKGRELLYHFKYTGTPIMIGGGVLAHTIIGIRWNSSTGDIKFLILDPHYTGAEDINSITRGGWCAWKGSDFWNKTAYYNLCLPIRPNVL